uniref:LigA n=1 Tax=Parastrongyloides trichosuri TaxID=131310 RepID=A0A0N5A027_PARTI
MSASPAYGAGESHDQQRTHQCVSVNRAPEPQFDEQQAGCDPEPGEHRPEGPGRQGQRRHLGHRPEPARGHRGPGRGQDQHEPRHVAGRFAAEIAGVLRQERDLRWREHSGRHEDHDAGFPGQRRRHRNHRHEPSGHVAGRSEPGHDGLHRSGDGVRPAERRQCRKRTDAGEVRAGRRQRQAGRPGRPVQADREAQHLRRQAAGRAGDRDRQPGRRRHRQGERATAGPAGPAAARRAGAVDRQPGAADHPVAVQGLIYLKLNAGASDCDQQQLSSGPVRRNLDLLWRSGRVCRRREEAADGAMGDLGQAAEPVRPFARRPQRSTPGQRRQRGPRCEGRLVRRLPQDLRHVPGPDHAGGRRRPGRAEEPDGVGTLSVVQAHGRRSGRDLGLSGRGPVRRRAHGSGPVRDQGPDGRGGAARLGQIRHRRGPYGRSGQRSHRLPRRCEIHHDRQKDGRRPDDLH